jgi:cell division protein FtsB
MKLATAPASRARGSQPHLKLVRRGSRNLIRRTRSRKVVPVVIVGAIVSVTLVFGILLERVMLSQSAFRLWDVRSELEQQQDLHEELLLEAARLESPGRIEHYARTNLGMVSPGSIEYIVADIPTRDASALRLGHRPRATTLPPSAPASAQGATP